jgi:hypothetical protein
LLLLQPEEYGQKNSVKLRLSERFDGFLDAKSEIENLALYDYEDKLMAGLLNIMDTLD